LTLVIWGVVAILLLLVLMKLPATAKFLLSPMKSTRERRRGGERRKHNVPVRPDRRRRPRRFEDMAEWYVERIAKKQELENSKRS